MAFQNAGLVESVHGSVGKALIKNAGSYGLNTDSWLTTYATGFISGCQSWLLNK
jgi:UDP-N-acetylenolpyruvoylglucosamine reductase